MLKKAVYVLITVALLALISFLVVMASSDLEAARTDFPIILNGSELSYEKDVVTIGGNTYVPLRETAEKLGINIVWNEGKSQVELEIKPQEYDFGNQGKSPDNPIEVSMISLIAHQERYHDKYIRCRGVWNVEFEDDRLYLSIDDWKNYNYLNAIWLDFDGDFYYSGERKEAEKFNGRYVIVEGQFDASTRLPTGVIRNITYYDGLNSRDSE